MMEPLFTSDAAMKKNDGCLTDAQLRAELNRCEYCEEKPCKEACPADCSPADFIMAARVGEKSDYRRAAALIMGSNPARLGVRRGLPGLLLHEGVFAPDL